MGQASDKSGQGNYKRAKRARCLLLVNPNSRGGDQAGDRPERALRRNGFEPLAGRVGDAAQLAGLLQRYAGALVPETDRVFVGGGDGTVNRLLSTLVQASVPVALLPLGTANDLARTLGVPADLDAAAAVACHGIPTRIDLGRVNDHLFANVASIGLGPKVTRRLTKPAKEQLGTLGYARALLAAYRETRPFRCRISVDGREDLRIRAIHLAVGNGRYYGGGAIVEENASIDDERLDLYALSPMPLWRLLLAGPWLTRGRHHEVGGVTSLQAARVSISTSRGLAISADGEIVARTPALFQVVGKALQVMVPGGLPRDGVGKGDDAMS